MRETVDPARILPCRWAYRDKNWAARKSHAAGESPGSDEPKWRCKSRLVIGGHRDPDLGAEALSTDAPTLSRPGFLCLMQRFGRWPVSGGQVGGCRGRHPMCFPDGRLREQRRAPVPASTSNGVPWATTKTACAHQEEHLRPGYLATRVVARPTRRDSAGRSTMRREEFWVCSVSFGSMHLHAQGDCQWSLLRPLGHSWSSPGGR